ncbi:MAG: hypothetical protein FJZ92_05655 [Chloroflexi bacterium]|nr:hypothetical protein [Chloroflexota bacterium]
MAALHAVQGALMLAISSDFALPVTHAFLEFDEATGRLLPGRGELFTLRIGPLVAGFLFLSAVAHLAVATVGFRRYALDLADGANYARWLEYAFSSSLMIVMIAMLTGIYDAASLVLIVAANASMILFGWMMERHNRLTERTDWTAFVFGCIAGAAPWLAIALYLWSPGQEGGPPGFVYGIFFSIFVFFNVFALNMVLQYRRVGPWRDYLYGERAYVVLSLVAKSALAWQVFAGTLRPS